MCLKRAMFAAVLVGTSGLTTITAADARHYRHVRAYLDPSVDASTCGPIPAPSAQYIYPEANWEPFFRHHVYRYGPAVACALAPANTNVISVRY